MRCLLIPGKQVITLYKKHAHFHDLAQKWNQFSYNIINIKYWSTEMLIELYVGDRLVKRKTVREESQVLSLHPLLHEKTNYHSNR